MILPGHFRRLRSACQSARRSQTSNCRIGLLSGLCLLFCAVNVSFATSGTWNNPAGGSWTNSANWNGGVIATNTDATADFSTLNLTADATVTLDRARTVGNLIFGDTTPDHNWTLNTGSAGPLTLAVSSGTPTINVSNQTATLGVVLASSQGFAKNGAGTLALNAANTFSGNTAVSQGMVTFGNTSAFGGGTITVGGGTGNVALLENVAGYLSANLTVNSQSGGTVTIGDLGTFNAGSTVHGFTGTITLNGDVTLQSSPDSIGNRTDFAGKISGTGNVAINDPTASFYKVIFGNNNNNSTLSNSWNGSLTINAGAMLQIGAGTSVGDGIPDTTTVTVNGKFNLAKNGNETIDALNGASTGLITRNASSDALTIGAANGSGNFAGVISGSIPITKIGTGTQIFGGTNTYTGATTISNGVFALGPNGSIASSTPITVAPGAVFDVSATPGFTLGASQTLVAGRTSNFANDIIGTLINSGTVNIVAAGTAGTLTLSSNLCLNGGTVNIGLAYANTTGAGVNDLIAVGGNLILTNTTTLSLSAFAGVLQTGASYTLLTYNGTLTGGVSNLALAGYSFSANSQNAVLAAGGGAVTLTVNASTTSVPPVLPYVIAASPWAVDQRGSQRVWVSVTQAVSAVRVDIPWRRRDSNPQNKNIVVVDATTGIVVSNRLAVSVTQEMGSVAFQPQTVPGNYYLYYLPFADNQNAGSYSGGYVSAQSTAGSVWLSSNGLPANASSLPAATAVQIEARLPIDNFWPMEVPMTTAEKNTFLAAHPDGYLVFPEDRLDPIKMTDQMPYRWLAAQPTNTFAGTAMRDEYFAFQLGIYAVTQSVQNVQLTFSNLVSGGNTIPASAFNCINLGGTNWDATPLTKTVNVSQGVIQPMWIGVLIPSNAVPGLYTSTVTVSAGNAPTKIVNLALTVTNAVAVDHGDDEPTNYTRLRWLDSQLGANDEVIPPYTPVTLTNQTIGVLGRTLTFTNLGLPASIEAGTNEILQSPVQFNVEVGGTPVAFIGGTPVVTTNNTGRVSWQSTATGGGLTLQTTTDMEFDGHLHYLMTLTANSATTLSDVKLIIPLTAAASTYMAGIGYDGGLRPSSYSWSWSTPHNSVWLGGVHAGLHTKLLGATYTGPMLNLYQPAAPATWGGGNVTVSNYNSGAMFQAHTGGKTLSAGAQVQYEFALLVTPMKPVDPVLQFGDRYYHSWPDPTPPSDQALWNVNVVNVHQGTAINPFINWPFYNTTVITNFVASCHTLGCKVKLYYTLREMTQYSVENWAWRSLNDEALEGGGGGGFPWLQEHYITDYTPGWYTPNSDGTYDAAVVTMPNTRYYNYYVEAVNWLAVHDAIDGLYLDDVSYDRTTLKRIRRMLKLVNPGSRIDLHSNTGFSLGPINQYAEFLPYLDRLWFGESFNYNSFTPEQWLVQCTGIPFGPMGEMLQGGGNPWLGAVFGITRRYGWNNGNDDPRPVWKIWDQFGGLTNATMLGWWESNPAVTTSDANVKATAFVKNGSTLLAVGNFNSSQTSVTLNINWVVLGLNSNTCTLYAPASSGFQAQASYLPTNSLTIPGKQGFLFIISTNNPGATNPTPSARLISQYRMSETNGTTAIDDTGNYNGQYVGNPVLGNTDVPTNATTALRSVTFSGGQWMQLPSTLADSVFRTGGAWTISFWVRPALSVPAYNATFSWMDTNADSTGILFYLESNDSLDFWIGDGSTWNNWPNYNPGTGLLNQWSHIAAAYDGLNLNCYLNGQLVKTAGISSFVYPAAGRPITVGLRVGASPTYDLHGKMTDLRIYNGILSATDIQSLSTYPGWHVPADAASAAYSTLGYTLASGTNLILKIPAVASWQYQLESSTNLAVGSWTSVGPVITSTPAGTWISITNSTVMPNRNFFRMRMTP